MIASIGADEFGEGFLKLWRSEGVNTAGVQIIEGAPTGVYFITQTPDGHRFSYRRAGSAASRMRPQDLPEPLLKRARMLHLSGISQAISSDAADAGFRAMEIMRAAGGRISYDPNLRRVLWPLARARAIIHEALRQADIALPGLEDAEALTGLADPDAIADYYLGLGPRIVALTLGAQGVLVATPDRRKRIAGISVAPVDATGAGDCFDGAFLAGLLDGQDCFAAAGLANAAAALSTLGHGAVAPIPNRTQVAAFLAAHRAED